MAWSRMKGSGSPIVRGEHKGVGGCLQACTCLACEVRGPTSGHCSLKYVQKNRSYETARLATHKYPHSGKICTAISWGLNSPSKNKGGGERASNKFKGIVRNNKVVASAAKKSNRLGRTGEDWRGYFTVVRPKPSSRSTPTTYGEADVEEKLSK